MLPVGSRRNPRRSPSACSEKQVRARPQRELDVAALLSVGTAEVQAVVDGAANLDMCVDKCADMC